MQAVRYTNLEFRGGAQLEIIYLTVISKWLVYKAVQLGDIIKSVSVDRKEEIQGLILGPTHQQGQEAKEEVVMLTEE